VHTGDPCAGDHVFSIDWIFGPETSNTRRSFGSNEAAVNCFRVSIMNCHNTVEQAFSLPCLLSHRHAWGEG